MSPLQSAVQSDIVCDAQEIADTNERSVEIQDPSNNV